MDPVTQGALGAATAQVILGNEPDRPQRIWIAGALGGMAADLDILIYSPSNPLLFYYFHRQFTHALAFIPIGGLLVALFLFMFSYFRKHWQITLFSTTIGYATHGLLDACTNYGTVLYWPWSNVRVHWDWIFIIDPLFSLPLLIGIALSTFYNNRKAVATGLIIAMLYMGWCAWQHSRALQVTENYFRENVPSANHIRALPALPGGVYWRGLARTKNTMPVIKLRVPVFGKAEIYDSRQYRLFNPNNIPQYIRQPSTLKEDLAVFDWFTDGYLLQFSDNPLVLADGRYLSGSGKVQSLWSIIFLPNQPHVAIKYFLIVRHLP